MLWLFAHWPERLFTRNTRFHPRRSIMGGWISKYWPQTDSKALIDQLTR